MICGKVYRIERVENSYSEIDEMTSHRVHELIKKNNKSCIITSIQWKQKSKQQQEEHDNGVTEMR